MKLLVAGRSVTLASVIKTVEHVTRIRPRVVFVSNAATSSQPHYLRFRSRLLLELDRAVPVRPLEVGIRNTWEHLLIAHARGVRQHAA